MVELFIILMFIDVTFCCVAISKPLFSSQTPRVISFQNWQIETERERERER